MPLLHDTLDDLLDARRTRYFMQVLDSGSVRGAADVLGMDPSAVSRAIGVLERDCGMRLLERRGRGVVPTEAGQLLATYLRRQHRHQQQLMAQFESIQKVELGHIGISTGEGFVDWLMRHSLRRFMHAHPGITIDLTVGGTDEIVRDVLEERAYIGLLFQPPRDDRLRSHHSTPMPIQALVHHTHPLTQIGRPLTLSDLLPYPGATLHRSFGVRQHVEAAELSEGVRLRHTLATSSFNAVSHFVAAGLGYTLGTQVSLFAGLDPSHVVALPMQNPLLSQGRIEVISRHGHVLPKAATTLLQALVADISRRQFG